MDDGGEESDISDSDDGGQADVEMYQKVPLLNDTDDAKSEGVLKVRDDFEFDQEETMGVLCKMIIVQGLPPSMLVKGEGFREFMSAICPEFCVPSLSTVLRYCHQIYMGKKLELKKYLKAHNQRFCLTVNTWSSLQKVYYVCLTTHFIDSHWKLNKKILNIYPVPSLQGDAIALAIETCLLDWNVESILTITVDDAILNDNLIASLNRTFGNLGCRILQSKLLLVRCIAHPINLIVEDTLKELGSLVAQVRGAVSSVRQSPCRLEQFKQCVARERIHSKSLLRLDDANKWNSTYMMLDMAQNCKRAFEELGLHDSDYRDELEMANGMPSEDDWANVSRLVKVLELFHGLVSRICCSRHITVNTFFYEIASVCCILQQWRRSDDMGLQQMADRIKEKYDRHLGITENVNMLIYVAAVLDPRYKLQFVEFAFSQMYEGGDVLVMGTKVRCSTYDIYNEYKTLISPQDKQASEKTQMLNSVAVDADQSDAHEMKIHIIAQFQKYKVEISNASSKSELDIYLSEVAEEDKDNFDVLGWWKLHSSRFPVLASMARDVLAIPISTVSPESAFNTGERFLDEYKSSLTPTILQALVCTQDWFRTSSHSHNVAEDLEELGKLESDLPKGAVEPAFNFT